MRWKSLEASGTFEGRVYRYHSIRQQSLIPQGCQIKSIAIRQAELEESLPAFLVLIRTARLESFRQFRHALPGRSSKL